MVNVAWLCRPGTTPEEIQMGRAADICVDLETHRVYRPQQLTSELKIFCLTGSLQRYVEEGWVIISRGYLPSGWKHLMRLTSGCYIIVPAQSVVT